MFCTDLTLLAVSVLTATSPDGFSFFLVNSILESFSYMLPGLIFGNVAGLKIGNFSFHSLQSNLLSLSRMVHKSCNCINSIFLAKQGSNAACYDKTWTGCITRLEVCFSSETKKGFCREGSGEDCYSINMAGNYSRWEELTATQLQVASKLVNEF